MDVKQPCLRHLLRRLVAYNLPSIRISYLGKDKLVTLYLDKVTRIFYMLCVFFFPKFTTTFDSQQHQNLFQSLQKLCVFPGLIHVFSPYYLLEDEQCINGRPAFPISHSFFKYQHLKSSFCGSDTFYVILYVCKINIW